jgi:hypothetical protein
VSETGDGQGEKYQRLDVHRSMKPDAVVMNEKLRRAHILEFDRPWDKDLTTVQDRAREKREHCAPLMDELQRKLPRGWNVTLHPMIIGVRGLTDEAQMTASLELMRMDEAQLEHVQDVMTREALAQGLMMWRARNACLKGTAEPDKDARTSDKEAAFDTFVFIERLAGGAEKRARARQLMDLIGWERRREKMRPGGKRRCLVGGGGWGAGGWGFGGSKEDLERARTALLQVRPAPDRGLQGGG